MSSFFWVRRHIVVEAKGRTIVSMRQKLPLTCLFSLRQSARVGRVFFSWDALVNFVTPEVQTTYKALPPPRSPCTPPQEILLRGLAVSVEPLLVDPTPPIPFMPPVPPPSNNASKSTDKVFLLDPTTVSAQAYVISRLPPRPPPLAPGGGGGSGGAERGPAVVRAISLQGEAWRTIRPSLLQNLPNLMRGWAHVSVEGRGGRGGGRGSDRV